MVVETRDSRPVCLANAVMSVRDPAGIKWGPGSTAGSLNARAMGSSGVVSAAPAYPRCHLTPLPHRLRSLIMNITAVATSAAKLLLLMALLPSARAKLERIPAVPTEKQC